MADTNGLRRYFGSVQAARDELQKRAVESIEKYIKCLEEAQQKGDFETAAKGWQWIIDHTPAGEDGLRVIDVSVDKPKVVQGNTGPTINLGFALGGITQPKELPSGPESEVAIEVEPIQDSDDKEN